jgi:hypothetical protein
MGGLGIVFRFMTNYIVKNPLNVLICVYGIGKDIYDRITQRRK